MHMEPSIESSGINFDPITRSNRPNCDLKPLEGDRSQICLRSADLCMNLLLSGSLCAEFECVAQHYVVTCPSADSPF